MSKRILAIALFAVMVLSLVPVSQAVTRTPNVVFEMGLTNQVLASNQTSTSRTPVNGISYPASADSSASIHGNLTKTSNFSSDWNVLSQTAAFGDLFKRAQEYSTDPVVRYDVWVKLAIGDAQAIPNQTATFQFANNTSLAVASATNRNSTTNNLGFLVNPGNAAVTPAVQTAKNFLDYAAITVNGNFLKTTWLQESYLAIETDQPNAVVPVTFNLYYWLKVGEFDVTDVASLSTDYTIVHKTISGTNTTKVRASFSNSGEVDKPIKPLYLKCSRTGDKGLYNIYVVNGVVFIDYAQDIMGSNYTHTNTTTGVTSGYAAIPVAFKFYEDAAATVRVPASNKVAYVVPGNDDTPNSADNGRFFVGVGGVNNAGNPFEIHYIDYNPTTNENSTAPTTIPALSSSAKLQVLNNSDRVLGVWLPNTYGSSRRDPWAANANRTIMSESKNRTMKVAIEDENFRYRTGDIKVVFRPLARNLITTAVIVERYLTIAVGEKITLTIESASATTYNDIVLSEISSVKSHVYIDGMNITGISVGTAQVQVSASNKVIDQITVNVVATKETTAPEVVAQWRVLARKLNIRSGPGTNYGKVGTLVMNQVVPGNDTGTGWIEIGAGQFVSKQYVVPVAGSITGMGNFTVNASSLNVRSGPGSSYAKTGSLPRGTIVEVIAIQNGWAQLATGGWVSTLYLI